MKGPRHWLCVSPLVACTPRPHARTPRKTNNKPQTAEIEPLLASHAPALAHGPSPSPPLTSARPRPQFSIGGQGAVALAKADRVAEIAAPKVTVLGGTLKVSVKYSTKAGAKGQPAAEIALKTVPVAKATRCGLKASAKTGAFELDCKSLAVTFSPVTATTPEGVLAVTLVLYAARFKATGPVTSTAVVPQPPQPPPPPPPPPLPPPPLPPAAASPLPATIQGMPLSISVYGGVPNPVNQYYGTGLRAEVLDQNGTAVFSIVVVSSALFLEFPLSGLRYASGYSQRYDLWNMQLPLSPTGAQKAARAIYSQLVRAATPAAQGISKCVVGW